MSEQSQSEVGWVILTSPLTTNFMPIKFDATKFHSMVWYRKPWVQKAAKGKFYASNAESYREFYNWYQGKWKRNYPQLYARRWAKTPYRRRR